MEGFYLIPVLLQSLLQYLFTWKEVKNVDTAWRELIGSLETDVAIDNARTSLDELGTAAAQAFTTGSTEDIAAYREQLLLATTDIMNLALNMDDISSHKVKVLVDIDGKVKKALLLNDLGFGTRESVYNACMKLEFESATVNGVPCAVWISISFPFRLVN